MDLCESAMTKEGDECIVRLTIQGPEPLTVTVGRVPAGANIGVLKRLLAMDHKVQEGLFFVLHHGRVMEDEEQLPSEWALAEIEVQVRSVGGAPKQAPPQGVRDSQDEGNLAQKRGLC